MKRFLLSICALVLLNACVDVNGYLSDRKEMETSAARIHSILEGTRLKDTNDYVVNRVTFELGVYNRALLSANAKAVALFQKSKTPQELELLSAVFNQQSLDQLETQNETLKDAFFEMNALCENPKEPVSVACQEYKQFARTIPELMHSLKLPYAKVLR